MSQQDLALAINIRICFSETSPLLSIAIMNFNNATSLQGLAKPSFVVPGRTSKDVSQFNHSPNDGVFAG